MALPAALAKLRANQPITPAEAEEIVASMSTGGAQPFRPAPSLALTGGGGGSGDGGGEGFLGGLKNLGHGILNTLATPGSAVVTTLGNAGLALAGQDTMPWSNVVAPWKGKSAGAELLGRLGVDEGLGRVIGGLGIDVAADPLWFLGAGKIAKVGEAVKDVRGVEHLTDAARAVGRVPATLPDVTLTPTRLTKVRPQHTLRVEDGAHPLGRLPSLSRRGRLVGDEFFVFRANKNNAKPVFQIARVQDPSHWRVTDEVLPHKFTSAADAEKAAHGYAQYLEDQFRAGSLAEGGVVTPNATREALGSLRGRLTQEATTPQEWAIRLGVGRLGKDSTFSKTFRTGITAKQRSFMLGGKTGAQIGKALNTRFVKHPTAKIARSLERATRDVQSEIAVRTKNLAKQLGLDAADASRIGTYLGVRRAGQSAGDHARSEMVNMGLWKPEYDDAVRIFDEHYGRMSKDTGHYTKEDVPRLQSEVEEHIAKGEDAEAVFKAQVVAQLEGRPYAPSARATDLNDKLREAVQESKVIGDPRTGGYLPGANPFVAPELPHPFAVQSYDDVVRQLTDELGLTPEQADELAGAIEAGLEHSTGTGFAESTHAYTMPSGELLDYRPNLNAFDLFSRRASMQAQKQLDDEVKALLKEAGLDNADDLQQARELIMRMTNTENIPGTLRSTGKAFKKFESATNFLKEMFTIWLPAHYIRNAAGDFVNDMVNGRLAHLKKGPQVGLDKYAKLVRAERRGDEALLSRTWTIGNRDYTGAELLTIARLSGAGVGTRISHGFVGEDIKAATDLLEEAVRPRNPLKRYRDTMKQLNVDRENAQRLRTWALHMDAGDDMFTAAIKTVRSKFDYGDLTNFERVWMRNVMLFYTWFRKNTPYHIGGLATRPGVYATAGQVEAGREKFANEPGYFSHLGLVPSLAGNMAFGNPIFDAMNKLRFTKKGILESTIGQMTPFIQVPITLATGVNPVTGVALADRPVSSPLFGRLPFIGTTASAYSRGPSGPAIDSRIAYILNAVSPGPVWAASAVQQPGYEGSAGLDLLGRLSGIRFMQDQPARFEAIANIRRREEEGKESMLRRYNVGE